MVRFCILVVFVVVGLAGLSLGVYHGRKIELTEASWSLSLTQHKKDKYWRVLVDTDCSAVLIKRRWALTSRRCVDRRTAELVKDPSTRPNEKKLPEGVAVSRNFNLRDGGVKVAYSVLGGTDSIRYGNSGVRSKVTEIYWDDTKDNNGIDMVLLHLDDTLENHRTQLGINPIEIAASGDNFDNKTCVQVGFGHFIRGTRDGYMHGANVTYIPKAQCKAKEEWSVCAEDLSWGAVGGRGDNGGGLVCPDKSGSKKLVGVSSGGAAGLAQGLFTSVVKFNDVITKVIPKGDL